MAFRVRSVLSTVFGALSSFTEGLSQAFDIVVDFAYVKVLGLPFIVLGYRQTGKTTA